MCCFLVATFYQSTSKTNHSKSV